MSQHTSSHRTPGWLKAAAGIGVPTAREPGWLKKVAGFRKVASPLANPAAAAAYSGNVQPASQPPKLTEEQQRWEAIQQQAEQARAARLERDQAARIFIVSQMLNKTLPEGGLTEEQQAEYNQILQQQVEALTESGFGEEDLAKAGYVFNRAPSDPGGSDIFVGAGSGRATATDVSMAKQHFAQQKKREEALISGDPEKIREVDFYDQHDFIPESSGRNLIPRDLDNAKWGPNGLAMVDYSGGQQRGRTGMRSEIGMGESIGMGFGSMFQGDAEDAKIYNRRADNYLKVGDWNNYEKSIRDAYQKATAAGDQETLEWLAPKVQNLERDRRKFAVQTWAEKYNNASSVKTPNDYQMPPRPPGDQFPEAAAAWDDVKWAREAGAKIPFIWEKGWGEEPAPIREHWQSWEGTKTDPYTGQVTYEGKRRPEHQRLLDQKAERERKAYQESGQAAHDDKARVYDAEMVNPQKELLAEYYSTDDPERRNQIHEEWKARNEYKETEKKLTELRKDEGANKEEIERLEEYKQQQFDAMRERGSNQEIYDTAASADQLQVDEWDQKANQLTVDYFKDDSLRGAYKTKEDYIEAALGKEPPNVTEARQRVQERRKNEQSLSAVMERSQKFFRQEEERTKQFEEAAMLAQYESGNAASESDMKDEVRKAAKDFQLQTRKIRVRAQAAAAAGRYDEAAELMARQDIMFKSGLKAAESGSLDVEALKEEMSMFSDDKAWGQVRDGFLQDPANRDLAQSYVEGTKANKDDFTAFYSSDPAQRIEAIKSRTARFDQGKARQQGPQPGSPADQMVAKGEQQKPFQLPPIGQPEPGQEQAQAQNIAQGTQNQQTPPAPQADANRPFQSLPPQGALREDPQAQNQQPQQPQQPVQPQQAAAPDQQAQQPQRRSLLPQRIQPPQAGAAQPPGQQPGAEAQQPQDQVAQNQSSFMPAMQKYDENGNPTDYYGNPSNYRTVNPIQRYDGSGRQVDENGAVIDRTPVLLSSGAPATGDQKVPGGPGSILPDRLRPNTEPSKAIQAGSSGGGPLPAPGVTPPGGAGITPGAPSVVGAPGAAPQQPAGQASGSLAPSNAAQAGIQKPQVPQVGLNKNKSPVGNPHGFTGTGKNRINPAGKTPAQLAKFTVGAETKTLNTNLFPKKVAGLKLADFKGARYLVNQNTGLEKIPLVGGMLNGMVRGMENATHFGSTGQWGRSALGVGQFGVNAGLLASSVIPVGAGASWGARAAVAGGRSLLGREAARQAARMSLRGLGQQASKGVIQPMVSGVKSLGSVRGAAGTAKNLAFNRFTGLIAADKVIHPDTQQYLSYAKINPGGQNTSLRGRLQAAVPPTLAGGGQSIAPPGSKPSLLD